MSLFEDLPLFLGLANAQHFGKAAAILNMPASTFSRRIAAMEKELGVALVNRSTRAFRLTEAGRVLFERGHALLEETDRLREELGDRVRADSGHIRIGLRLEVAHLLFVPLLSAFVRDNPGVSLEVLTTDGQPHLADGIDLAFVVSHQNLLRDSSQTAHRIGQFPRHFFASKKYLQKSVALRTPDDLRHHACLRLSHRGVEKTWELRRGREICRINVDGPVSSTSVGLLAQFAREHQGIAALWPYLAQQGAFGGGLVRVLPEWEAVPGRLFALTERRPLPRRVARLLEFVKGNLSQRLRELASS